MAPGSTHREVRKGGPPRQAENRWPSDARASVFLLLDVLDHLGHIVLVLTQFRGVLEELFVLLFGFFERDRLFILFDGLGLLGFGFGVELVGTDRLQLLFDRRRWARAARLQKRFRVKRSAAF